jgi:hypothetical protein
MAKERTGVRMQAQIRVLSEQGHSVRSIARMLRLSRRTVAYCLMDDYDHQVVETPGISRRPAAIPGAST